MPKKKPIARRLEKLFEDVKTEKSPAELKPASRKRAAEEKPALQPAQTKPIPKSALQLEMAGSVTTLDSAMSLAFQSGQDSWATLQVLDETEQRKWTPDEQLLVKQVADQLSLALENARLFQETQRRAQEMSALAEVAREVSATLNLEKVLDRIAEYAKTLLQVESSAVYLPDARNFMWTAISAIGNDVEEIKADPLQSGRGILGSMVLTKAGRIVNDASNSPDAVTISGTVEKDFEHIMGVPILSRDRVTGLMAVWRTGEGKEFLQNELDFLSSLSQQAAVAIENARLFENAQYNAAIEGLISQISSGFVNVSADEVDAQINHALQKIAEFSRIDRAYLFQFAEDGKTMDNTHEWADEGIESYINDFRNVPTDVLPYMLGHIQKMQIFYAPSVKDLPDEASIDRAELLRERIQSIICVPIIMRGKTQGFIGFDSVNQPKVWNDQDINMLRLVGEILTGALQRQKAEFENRSLFQEVTESQSQLSEALRIARIGYFEIDLGSQKITFTDELFALLNTSAEKEGGYQFPLDQTLKKFVMAEDIPVATRPVRDAINAQSDQGSLTSEVRYKTMDGRIIWVSSTYKIERDSTGQAAKIAGSSQDITERKISEQVLQRRSTYLAASSEIGRLVTSTLDLNTIFTRTVNLISERFGFYFAAIYINEEAGFNTALREATGGAGEKMKAQRHSVVIGFNSVVGKVAETGEPILVNDVTDQPLFHPNPLLPDTRSEVAISMRIGSRIVGVIDIQSTEPNAFTEDDISVLQSLADQVAVAIDNARSYELSQQLIKELREVDLLKSQFLANMSHELRTPLNSIIGFSRVILKGIDGPVTDMQQQDLTAIYNSGQHLLGLINDVLDLARIEAGKMELNFEEVHLAEMATSVMSTAKGLVKEKPIHLIQHIPADMPKVRGDAMRVRQVLLNLISNATKFTDEGSITVETVVQKSPTGKMEALINVIDTGPGIAPEDQEKLFKAFSQVDGSATRKSGGSGLGLSICANLVQLHGGRIGIHSEIGKGSTFWFTLPLFHQPQEEIPEGRKVVLAIDDDPQVIALYERYLNPQGYYVVPLTDPSRAKQRIMELKPYAVTLDIMMPNVDGWTVLNELKSDAATRDVPVIVCSIMEQADKGFSLGASDYLVKPILEEDLVHALNRLNKDGTIREVLVIDDDPNDLRLIEKILSEHGQYKPTLAEGGRKGWEAMNEKAPDAIILDIFMPEMDGFTILEKLRESPALSNIPVLVVSGGGLTNEQQKQLSDFGQRLITKGSLLKEGELISSIENALRRIG